MEISCYIATATSRTSGNFIVLGNVLQEVCVAESHYFNPL